jgi:hypothetical protein
MLRDGWIDCFAPIPVIPKSHPGAPKRTFA